MMSVSISDGQLSRFSRFVDETMGLHFPRPRWPDLQRGMTAAARELGFDDAAECMQRLMSAPLRKEQIEILAGNLTVGETYFFREQKSFEVLAHDILPPLMRSRLGGERRLRIWSAACCTGEEPYSLAIALRQAMPDWAEWNLTILATDINPRFLRKAMEGRYGRWSFRDTPAAIIERYFRETGDGHFEIAPEIKAMVWFAQLNLVDDVYPAPVEAPGAMDVIFCRNVLMYFSPRQAKTVVQKLYRVQADGGWLVVSPSESYHVFLRPYRAMNFRGAILYKKESRRSEPAEDFTAVNEIEATTLDPQSGTAVVKFFPQLAAEDQKTQAPAASVQHDEAGDPVLSAYLEGVSLYGQGRYAEAVQRLLNCISGPSPRGQAFDLLARASANQGKLPEALHWCDRGIAAEKLNASHHYLRAVVLQEQGALEEAAGSLRRALYLDPDFVLCHFALGNVSRIIGKTIEARKHLENALRLLRGYPPDAAVPESDGISAGRLIEVITLSMRSG